MTDVWLSEIIKPNTDWAKVERTFPHVAALRACIQDPIHHAEGDVWTHTRMVTDALSRFDLGNDPAARLAGLYHDVEKPRTRVVEWSATQGRETVGHPKHARLGAATAWYELWQAGLDVQTRLAVHAIIAWHQRVFHLWTYPDMQREIQKFSAIGNWTTLINFARADNAGRICANPQEAEDSLLLLAEWISENKVDLDEPSRMVYFEKDDRSPFFKAVEPAGSRVIVLSGLPGVGKDRHIATRLPGWATVSLDGIRREMDIGPTDNQGRVIQEGLERARRNLREKTSFVWNSTGLSRLQRGKIVGLCRAYDAHVSIHAFDAPLTLILRQNEKREHPVPQNVIMDLSRKWEPPTALEAHQVHWF